MGLGASRADHKKDDGYVPPSDRARARQAPAPSAVLTDPDVAAFDPTADKHDYLLVFATERSRSSETLKWNDGNRSVHQLHWNITMRVKIVC